MSLPTTYTQIDLGIEISDIGEELRAGLSEIDQKRIPSKWLYDDLGSDLFEQICELPEYYPTRTETAILEANAERIVDRCPSPVSLVELGSGSSRKTKFLIEAVLQQQSELAYHAIDISKGALDTAADWMVDHFDRLNFFGITGDYRQGLDYLDDSDNQPRLILFLGSTIGNFAEGEIDDFLEMMRAHVGTQDRFLLGFDLFKSLDTLLPAYNDSQGITAEFNLNTLQRLNKEFGANFDLDSFSHDAIFNQAKSRIEMHLVSLKEQSVSIPDLDLSIRLKKGETIHTENSYKHSEPVMRRMVERHGFSIDSTYRDRDSLFCVYLLK